MLRNLRGKEGKAILIKMIAGIIVHSDPDHYFAVLPNPEQVQSRPDLKGGRQIPVLLV
jgi:hypothetical protein